MLRESSKSDGAGANLRGVVDPAEEIAVAHGEVLRALADALVAGDQVLIEAARADAVDALGPEATVTAIGVVANFQMMNRALDAVGIPAHLDPGLADQLGIDPDSFGGTHGAVG